MGKIVSAYNNCIDISEAEKQDKYIIYNSLYGTISFLNDFAYEEVSRCYRDKSFDTMDETLSEILLSKRYLIKDKEQEDEFLLKVRNFIHEAKSTLIQYGILLSPNTHNPDPDQDMLDHIFKALDNLIDQIDQDEKNDKQFYFYIWALDHNEDLEMLYQCFDHLLRLINARLVENNVLVVLHTNGFVPIDYKRLLPYPKSPFCTFLLKITASLYYARNFDTIDLYMDSLLDTSRKSGEAGFTSELYFEINEKSKEIMLTTIFDTIRASGLAHRSIRPYILLLPVKERTCDTDFLCDLVGMDWDMLYGLMHEINKSYKFGYTKLWGPGITKKLDKLISRRMNLRPDIYFCPLAKNSYIFDMAGRIWPCPKSAAENSSPDHLSIGSYLPRLAICHDTLNAWQNRDVTRIEECASCVNAFFCAGGCPYEAYTKNKTLTSPVCQPVEDIVKNGIIANYNKLTKQFGPQQRMAE